MTLVKKIPSTFNDNFHEYKTQAEADTAWPSSDVAQMRVNITNRILDVNFDRKTTIDQVGHDLGIGNVSDTKWTLRFKITFNLVDDGGNTGTKVAGIGIVSTAPGVPAFQAGQDGVFMLFNFATDTAVIVWRASDNATLISSTTASPNLTHDTQQETLWIQMTRTEPGTMVLELYSDPNYTKLIERAVNSSTLNIPIANLRYIKFWNFEVSGPAPGDLNTSVTDIQFWNDLLPTEIEFNEPNFEDKFEVDKGWVKDAGTRIAVNTAQKRIDWDADGGSQFFETLTYDLGQSVSETFWTLRFKLNIDNVVVGVVANPSDVWVLLSNNTSDVNVGQDSIGMTIPISAFDPPVDNKVRIGSTNNAAPTGGGYPQANRFGPEIVSGMVIYVEVRRIRNLKAEVNLYADAGFTQLLGTRQLTVQAGNTGLRFLKVAVANRFASGDNLFSGSIEDMELFSDKSSTKIQEWRVNNG